MGCRCGERRSAILNAVKRPSTALTAVKFVAKTSVDDLAGAADQAARRMVKHLQRRGPRT